MHFFFFDPLGSHSGLKDVFLFVFNVADRERKAKPLTFEASFRVPVNEDVDFRK